ncbi:MBL fold metallo-hydrolase [Sphingomonas sp. KRR8]|uniref:MBL fold metallo-hydrolase n=1 Tax=Sphingomonas sp. KRR8 TaxID=2942996 RepID=UPI002021BD53|nr:MBL fold metallo-hydrolase [Sphingomonas sp. KRR8]URD61156.1 MBL fold metallo-hydrolase [Sphingomonas sp. KRR8]
MDAGPQPPPTLTFHGAARTVTGSCYELELGGKRLLIDCGLVQGPRALEALNRQPFAFTPAELGGVILTHAHVDHSGLLPRLVREGFTGPIYCTSGTADLLAQMLPDAGRIQEYEAEQRNRRPDRRGEPPAVPIYTEADAQAACAQAVAIELGTPFHPIAGVEARLWNAGHILGSASVEVLAGATRLLFSGDLGPDNKSFHASPGGPVEGIDHLLCESTYGDRDREEVSPAERRRLLKDEIQSALARGGNLLIPSFALERTQELLLDIAILMNRGELPRVHVFIDSPLASRVTGVFARHARELEDLDGTEVFHHPAFHFVETPEQSIRLNDISGAIILAASGMCEAGRVRHHLVHNLPRHNSTVLFVGYQAAGTLGRHIVEGAQRVRISGREVNVRAQIRRLDCYSAHADRGELLQWVRARGRIAGTTFLTHGESGALQSLADELGDGGQGGNVRIPEIGECYELPPSSPARRLKTGRDDVRGVLASDWQTDLSEFTLSLRSELRKLESETARREAVRRMREALKDYEKQRHHPAAPHTHQGEVNKPIP